MPLNTILPLPLPNGGAMITPGPTDRFPFRLTTARRNPRLSALLDAILNGPGEFHSILPDTLIEIIPRVVK